MGFCEKDVGGPAECSTWSTLGFGNAPRGALWRGPRSGVDAEGLSETCDWRVHLSLTNTGAGWGTIWPLSVFFGVVFGWLRVDICLESVVFWRGVLLVSGRAEGLEVCEELGEGDGGGFGSFDLSFGGGAKGGDGEGHGYAVVGAGVDGCSVEGLVAGDGEAVGVFGEGCAHGAQVFGYEGDAVGLFYAEFPGVADDEAGAGVGGDGGEDRELVDELGG